MVFGIQWSQGEGNVTSGPNYQIGGGGSTGATGGGTNQIGGSVNASQVTITLMEIAMTYHGTGSLNAAASISGTYSRGTSACMDSGTFVATHVPNGNLVGNYRTDLAAAWCCQSRGPVTHLATAGAATWMAISRSLELAWGTLARSQERS